MSVYRKIICPACGHVVESRKGDKIKEITCVRCQNTFKLTPDNSSYYIDYCCEGRRYREKVGPHKLIAEKAFAKRQVEIAENKFLDIKKENDILFDDFSEEYLNLHSKVNNKAWKMNDARSIRVLKKTFTGHMLSEITPVIVEKYKQKTLERLKPASVNRYLACLQSMFNKAIAWEKFSGENPVAKVKKLKENNARTRFLSTDETKRLMEHTTGTLKTIITIAIGTGMRKGEILSLRWDAISFERNLIYLTRTKNGEHREVPLNERVMQALMTLPKNISSPYLFDSNKGQFMSALRNDFENALTNAKITNFRFHDLRHTAASYLIMSGADLNTVREILGHKSMQMTMRYAHLTADHKKRAIDLLSKRLASVLPPETSEKIAPVEAVIPNA